MKMKDDPDNGKFYDLCLAKRGAVELYDCEKDPDQVNNLAANPECAETIRELRARLVEYLKSTDDQRFTDKPVRFEEYPFEDYLSRRKFE